MSDPRKDPNREIAVISPEPMLGVFDVLIQSAPHLHLIASATSLETLQALLAEKSPDAILIYLVQECEAGSGTDAFKKINQLKTTWPDILRIAIVKYASQQEKAVEMGADLALVEGVSAERLLVAIEEKFN